MKRIVLILSLLLISIVSEGQYRQPCPWNPDPIFGGDVKIGAGPVFGGSVIMITRSSRFTFGLSGTYRNTNKGVDQRFSGNYYTTMTADKAGKSGHVLTNEVEYRELTDWTITPTIGYRYKRLFGYGGLGMYRRVFEDITVRHYTDPDGSWSDYSGPGRNFTQRRTNLNLLLGARIHVSNLFYFSSEFHTAQNTLTIGVGILGWNSINFNSK